MLWSTAAATSGRPDAYNFSLSKARVSERPLPSRGQACPDRQLPSKKTRHLWYRDSSLIRFFPFQSQPRRKPSILPRRCTFKRRNRSESPIHSALVNLFCRFLTMLWVQMDFASLHLHGLATDWQQAIHWPDPAPAPPPGSMPRHICWPELVALLRRRGLGSGSASSGRVGEVDDA